MYDKIEIPIGVKMLYNVLKLKDGIDWVDLELAIGEMCRAVNQTYGNEFSGFVGGQVFRFSGFVSPQGFVNSEDSTDNHVAIITYWRSFDQHEKSHADIEFLSKFRLVNKFCESTHEMGYELLWQGSASSKN